MSGEKSKSECPTCGRDDFKNEYGMKIHHSQAHNQSIAGKEMQCVVCGSSFRATPSEVEDRETCSEECQNKRHSRRMAKEPVEHECPSCGCLFKTKPSKSHRIYCSPECYRSNQSAHMPKGDQHPEYQGGKIQSECAYCGDTFDIYPSRENKRVVCGQECYGKYFSEKYSGRDNPNYANGRVDSYGPNWSEQRKKRIKLDNSRCVVCGMSRGDHINEYNSDLEVHHITPRSEFLSDGIKRLPEEANQLDNLITLCKSCHGKWERIPLRPEVFEA